MNLIKVVTFFISRLPLMVLLVLCRVAQSLSNSFKNDSYDSIVFSEGTQRQQSYEHLHERQLQSPYFNLRLYWRPGYHWQDSPNEAFWCISCTSPSCSRNSSIQLRQCDRNDRRQHFYFDGTKIRSRENKEMCFTRIGRSIRLSTCERKIRDQIWSGLSMIDPFELKIPGNEDKCASQHHHPKDKERVYMESCKLTRHNDVGKWTVY